MKVFRVFTPVHSIAKAGTIEMGVFSSRATARDRMSRLVLEMETWNGATATWKGDDLVVVRIDNRDSVIRIMEYELDDPSAKSILTELPDSAFLAMRPGNAHLN